MWPMLAMAAGSMYMQNEQNKRAREMNKANAEVAATQTQFSPWTGNGVGKYNHENQGSMVGAGLQGGMSGLSMQQQFDQAAMNKELAGAQADYYKSQSASPWVNNAKLVGNQHQMAGGYGTVY